ncbi:MAG TPA: ADYC domain-containing protein [Kofleriaceae bacterium]|nr:ADYC domain-containing protein [Kofleriaceae bacterium]
MMRFGISTLFILSMTACALDEVETSTGEQAGSNLQGSNLQGVSLQGMTVANATMQGFRSAGASLGGASLTNLRVERGELIAEQGSVTLRGTALAGAQLQAQVRTSGSTTALLDYRIAGVEPELSSYDPTQTGSTFLYRIEQWVADSSSWQPACGADLDGRHVAIPLAATWDEHGARAESSSLFTLGCTTGVIAKCYRWGYRPWVTGYGDLVAMHWTCTRLARADYCGDGVSHTRDGTLINVWDTLPPPGPVQSHGETPAGMTLEAAWNTGGAVCFSHPRWLTADPFTGVCADRVIPPDLGGVACDAVPAANPLPSQATMFNESLVNIAP